MTLINYSLCVCLITELLFQTQRRDPLVMWLSGLHVPESYLTALVQVACRKQGWPLDRSTLYTSVTDFVHEDEVEIRPEMVSSSSNFTFTQKNINTNKFCGKGNKHEKFLPL